mgnify:CR=1 FL=1
MKYALLILAFLLVAGCTTNKNSLVFMDQKQGVFWRSAAGGLGAGSDVENAPEGGAQTTVPLSGTVPGLESIGAISSVVTNMPEAYPAP